MGYAEARELAKRWARALGHKPGRFEFVGFAGDRSTNCKICYRAIGVTYKHGGYVPCGKGTIEPCLFLGFDLPVITASSLEGTNDMPD